MESFGRRLKLYGIGFGIGLIFVFFFFRNRGCSWLPDNRVKNSILDRVIVVSDSMSDVFISSGISDEDIIQVLNDGDVVFDKSLREGDSKIYVIEKDGKSFSFTLPYESFVSEVFMTDDISAVKSTSNGDGRFLRFPMDDDLVYVDSTSELICLQDELGLINPRDILTNIKESGSIDFSKTDFSKRPKAEHYIYFDVDTNRIGANVIWYKNKLNISHMKTPYKSKCSKN